MTKQDDLVAGLAGTGRTTGRTVATVAIALAVAVTLATVMVLAVDRLMPTLADGGNGGDQSYGISYRVSRQACIEMLHQPGLDVRVNDGPEAISTGMTEAEAATHCSNGDRNRIEMRVP